MKKRILILGLVSLIVFISQGISQDIKINGNFFKEFPESSLDSEQASRLSTIKSFEWTETYRTVTIPEIDKLLYATSIKLNLFPSKHYQSAGNTAKLRSDSDFTWIGSVDDIPGSVTLVKTAEGVTGTVHGYDKLYKIQPIGSGIHVVRSIDQSKLPPDHPPGNKYGSSNSEHSTGATFGGNTAKSISTMIPSSTTVIDVIVSFTQSVADNCDEWATIELAISETNTSLSESGVNDVTINLVDTNLVTYSEANKTYTQHLNWFDDDAGTLSSMQENYADIAILLVNDSEANGLAKDIPAGDTTEAYCVVYYENATGYYSFGHEIGHLLGCRHAYCQDATSSYYHGFWREAGEANPWRTIMVTDEGKPEDCERIQRWSNPSEIWNGKSMGITNAGSIGMSPNLSWNSSTGATSYKVYRTGSPVNWEVIVTRTTTSYTDYDVLISSEEDADDKFYYKVTALNSHGESGYSNIVSTWGETFQKLISEDITKQEGIPKEFALHHNYPNPFNPITTIKFDIPEASHVYLQIFDIKGREMRTLVNEYREAGSYTVLWDTKDDRGVAVPTGLYIYRFQAREKVFTNKLTLMK